MWTFSSELMIRVICFQHSQHSARNHYPPPSLSLTHQKTPLTHIHVDCCRLYVCVKFEWKWQSDTWLAKAAHNWHKFALKSKATHTHTSYTRPPPHTHTYRQPACAAAAVCAYGRFNTRRAFNKCQQLKRCDECVSSVRAQSKELAEP